MSKPIRSLILAIVLPVLLLAAITGSASIIALARPEVEVNAPPAAATGASAPRADTERLLQQRGLIGDHHVQAGGRIEPSAGTEVYETVEAATGGGQVMSRTTSWSEPLNGDMLWIEATDYPSHQHQLSFWVLSGKSRGCAMFGRTMYSQDGRRLQSEFWRNDRALRITGAADFPPDLYPAAVPAVAMRRELDSLRAGARGRLSQQITPYGYVDLDLSVASGGELTVPAGQFAACKVTSQADVAKLLPNWPHMLLRVVNPFVPATTYYFQCAPPYRFLKKQQQGSPFVGGPEAVTELVRFYTAGRGAQADPGARRQLAALKPRVR
jgi:hypothetical protein